MKKKDKKAIESLSKHRDKLNDPALFNSVWVSKLSDLLLKYLGENSQLYKSALSWYSFAENGNRSQIATCVQILDSTIEYIEDNGVVRNTSFWRTLESMNSSVLYSLIIFIITSIFWLGFWIGDIRQTKIEYDLLHENKTLKEKLSESLVKPKSNTLTQNNDTTVISK